jgi:hypothetical protein
MQCGKQKLAGLEMNFVTPKKRAGLATRHARPKLPRLVSGVPNKLTI